MRWSLKIAQVAGIGIFVHWTFFLLLAWVVYAYLSAGQNDVAAFEGVILVLAIFACVVLHELGHALTGRHFGVQTRDITLLPIGGVARLESIPEVPMQELWIAVAGPAVNVVIAVVLFVILAIAGDIDRWRHVTLLGGPFLGRLMAVNIMLVLFNLLPAFPMDGGRVLRPCWPCGCRVCGRRILRLRWASSWRSCLVRQEFLAGNGCWCLSPSSSTSEPRPNRTWSRCDRFSKVLVPGMP